MFQAIGKLFNRNGDAFGHSDHVGKFQVDEAYLFRFKHCQDRLAPGRILRHVFISSCVMYSYSISMMRGNVYYNMDMLMVFAPSSSGLRSRWKRRVYRMCGFMICVIVWLQFCLWQRST